MTPGSALGEIAGHGFLDVGETGEDGLGLTGELVVVDELARGWGALALGAAAHFLATRAANAAASPRADRGPRPWAAALALTDRDQAGALTVQRVAGQWRIEGRTVPAWIDEEPTHVWVTARDEFGDARAFQLERRDCRLAESVELDAFASLRLVTYEVDGTTEDPGSVLGTSEVNELLAAEHLLTAALRLGVASAAQEAALRYAGDRHQFNRPIGTFGEIFGMLANSDVELAAAWALTWEAASVWDRRRPSDLDRRPDAGIMRAALMAGRVSTELTERAQHIHGGYGHLAEFEVGRMTRDVRSSVLPGRSEASVRRRLARTLGLTSDASRGACG